MTKLIILKTKNSKKCKIKTVYLNSSMSKSYFVLEKLCPVNNDKKNAKSVIFLVLPILWFGFSDLTKCKAGS